MILICRTSVFRLVLHCTGVRSNTYQMSYALEYLHFHIYKYCALVSNCNPEMHITISSTRVYALNPRRCPTTRFMMASVRLKKKISSSTLQQLFSCFFSIKKRIRQKEIILIENDQGEKQLGQKLYF